MSLTQALKISASGLRAAQAGLALVSSNVANAETPGYVRKTLVQTAGAVAGSGASVSVVGVNRELDEYVQRQLRVEMAGGSYAELRARFYDRLQLVYGTPGSSAAIETLYGNFTNALQALAATPNSSTVRLQAVHAAQVLAQRLNGLSADIQALRAEAESGLAEATANANEAMQAIAQLNQQLAGARADDPAAAALMDQRDRLIDQLAQLMDIRVVKSDGNQLIVFTNSGVQLVGLKAARLEFEPQSAMTATAQWSADPSRRGVGTLTLVSPNGDGLDLIASGSIRSGAIAAYVEMRDQALVAAQAQLDAFAAAMAQALSDKTEAGTAVTVGAQSGFDLDLGGLVAGNTVRVTSTDASGTQRSITFVRVDDPAALPLDPGPDPNDRIVGISFSGGAAAVAGQIAAALGAGFTVSNPAGSTLRILDDGGATVTLNAATTTKTVTGLASGDVRLPLFVDGLVPYTGAYTAEGAQMTGLAGRIAVNAAVLADPSKLVVYGAAPTTAAGEGARPTFLYDQLTQATLRFAAPAGSGGGAATVQATLPGFLRQILAQQGEEAAAAASLRDGQAVVVDALRQRMNDVSQVNIDEEMTNLLRLQSAYSANARVLAAVRDMLDTLLRL